ncbi:MAG TPA: histidine kinase [Bacteroidales bacterium]|nr:histidine kinase [Bacteroidales bacterium]
MSKSLKSYHPLFIIVVVFLFLFLGALRLDPWVSLIFAFVDTVWLTLFVFLFVKLFQSALFKKCPRVINMFTTVLVLAFFISLLLISEGVILKYVLKEMVDLTQIKFPLFRDTMLGMGSLIGAMGIRSGAARKQAEQLIKEKQEMELHLLRSRMDPHFVFNALNVLYSLSYTKDEKAPDMIMKLAEMLRYITDECKFDKVSIEKEVKYIENYIDFQRTRMGRRPNLTFRYSLDNPGAEISPMLLQPLVENCFKHGDIANNPAGEVSVVLSLKDNRLYFTAENSMSVDLKNDHETLRDGTGIANVKQRLELYYPMAHSIQVFHNDNKHKVVLSIYL